MGSTVSVCNLTAVILNVALKHASPVYYHNELQAGECAYFKPGRVWFTVEAKVWINGTNEYDQAQVALPITSAVLTAPIVAGFGGVVGLVALANHLDEKKVKGTEEQVLLPNATAESSTATTVKGPIDIGKVAAAAAGVGGILVVPGAATGIAGTVVNTDTQTPKEWRMQKMGVYMSPGRRIEISGGPATPAVRFGSRAGRKYQCIDQGQKFNPLVIE